MTLIEFHGCEKGREREGKDSVTSHRKNCRKEGGDADDIRVVRDDRFYVEFSVIHLQTFSPTLIQQCCNYLLYY